MAFDTHVLCVNGGRSDTKDEVWLGIARPAQNPCRVVFSFGDSSYHQLALAADHHYTNFALETRGEERELAVEREV